MIAKFKMKKAFILPFVLIFVLSLSIIVVNFIENFNNKIKAPVYDTITTKNLIYQNVETILKSKLKQFKSTEDPDLKKIFELPILLNDKKNTLDLELILSKKYALIDINKIKLQDTFWSDQFDDRYNMSEAGYFFDLLQDVKKNKSILANDNYRFIQGKIYNIAHLQQIIDYYYKQTNDKNIKTIPFSKIFCFDTCEKKFYCESAKDNEALKVLLGSKDDYTEEDGYIIECNDLQQELSSKIQRNYKINTIDKIKQLLIGDLDYIVNDVKYKVNFVYNLEKSKIKEFDVKEN
jgi:hypothetical protein